MPGSRAALDARMNHVKGRTFPTSENGCGRRETGKSASEKTISRPETYVGRAHSNFEANIAYAPSRNPSPIDAKKFTTRASAKRTMEIGVRMKGIATSNRTDVARTATIRDIMEVTIEVAKEPRHLPARYGGGKLGETENFRK